MDREDPEAFLREMLAPLSTARPGESLRRVPFSHEAVANAFVMLGLLPEVRAEEILAGYRTELEAKGFRFGVLTGELSIGPGAHGYQDARATRRGDLTGIPLAAAGGPVPLPVPGGRAELNLNWATLTPGGAKLRLAGTTTGEVSPPRPGQLPYRMVFSQDPALGLANKAASGLSVTDDLGRAYRLRPGGWRTGPRGGGQPGRSFEGDVLAEPGRVLPGRAGLGDIDVDRHGRPHGRARHREDRRRGGGRAVVGRGAAARQRAADRDDASQPVRRLAARAHVPVGHAGLPAGTRQ